MTWHPQILQVGVSASTPHPNIQALAYHSHPIFLSLLKPRYTDHKRTAPEPVLQTGHRPGLPTCIHSRSLHTTARQMQPLSPLDTWSHGKAGTGTQSPGVYPCTAYLHHPTSTTAPLTMPFLLPAPPFFTLLTWLLPPSSSVKPRHCSLLSVPTPSVLSTSLWAANSLRQALRLQPLNPDLADTQCPINP